MRRRILEVLVAMAVGASACCLSDISGMNVDGGDLRDGGEAGNAGDAGTLEKDKGCPADQLYMGICWCQPHFTGCPDGGVMCFYETDAGCIHTDCISSAWDDQNCGRCGKACKPGTHCGDPGNEFAPYTCVADAGT